MSVRSGCSLTDSLLASLVYRVQYFMQSGRDIRPVTQLVNESDCFSQMVRFRGCTFAGPIVQTYRDEDADRAARFEFCRFTDDPRLSPTGAIRVRKPAAPIADLGAGDVNVRFSNCVFDLSGEFVLPWSQRAIYENCTMRQVSLRRAYPRGTYVGTNSITGNVKLTGSKVVGVLTVNGVRYDG